MKSISLYTNLLLCFIIKHNTGDNMVQAIINIGEFEDRVLTIVKGKYGLKNKSEAVNFVIDRFGEDLLEPKLRPEFVKKIKSLEKKGRFKTYKSVSELKKEIENA
jgi:hypothetical protein